jgi:hypothetical protein
MHIALSAHLSVWPQNALAQRAAAKSGEMSIDIRVGMQR